MVPILVDEGFDALYLGWEKIGDLDKLTELGGFASLGSEGEGFARGGEEVLLVDAWVWANLCNNRFFKGVADIRAS